MIAAKSILSTRSPWHETQPPIYTMELTMPRFILAQFNKHGTIPSNCASSRAVPHSKIRQMVLDNPVIPTFKQHQKGMEANEDMDAASMASALNAWNAAMKAALDTHEQMEEMGVSKGQANRLLEPFMYVTLIATGQRPAWEHLIKLRNHKSAQSEFQELAQRIETLIDKAVPVKSNYHIPYTDCEPKLENLYRSVARCARVSYLNHGKDTTLDQDKALFERLKKDGHLSPFEHVCRYSEFRVPRMQGRLCSMGSKDVLELRTIVDIEYPIEMFFK